MKPSGKSEHPRAGTDPVTARRDLLKATVAGGTAAAIHTWATPAVSVAVLPAHAATTGVIVAMGFGEQSGTGVDIP